MVRDYRTNGVLVIVLAVGCLAECCPCTAFDDQLDLSPLRSVTSVDKSSEELPSLRISTESGEAFSFDIHAYGLTPTPTGPRMKYGKWSVEEGSPSSTLLWEKGGTTPIAANFGSDLFVLSQSATWHRAMGIRWGIFVDYDHFNGKFADARSVPEGENHWILFDLQSCLRRALQSGGGTVQWNEPIQTSVITTPTVRVLIRQRSPNDRLRLGTALSLLSAEKSLPEQKIDASIRVASFRRGERIRFRDAATESRLAEVLEAMPARGRITSHIGGDKAALNASKNMWQSAMTKPLSGEDRRILQQIRTEAIEAGAAEIVPAIEMAAEKGRLKPYVEVLMQQLAELNRIARNGSDGQTLSVDDPTVRWNQVIEQIFPAEMLTVQATIYPDLLRTPQLSLELKLLLVDAVGELGDPLIPFFDAMFEGIEDDDWMLFDALLKARWQMPWTEEHIERCVEALSEIETGTDAELALMETLIRMDETAQIPINRMHRWFDDGVVDASAFERSEALRILTLVPSGRHYLLAHLRSDAFLIPEDARTRCLDALRRRAAATRHFGQYEFLSEQECHAIEKYLAEQDEL